FSDKFLLRCVFGFPPARDDAVGGFGFFRLKSCRVVFLDSRLRGNDAVGVSVFLIDSCGFSMDSIIPDKFL
ncbi:hypothetical protein, partial [Neisseria meningitidis]|uniref:hypothetical protein n=1 Tax=Neisseria meningitidis TaxID=487 RepID=UPI001E60DD4C